MYLGKGTFCTLGQAELHHSWKSAALHIAENVVNCITHFTLSLCSLLSKFNSVRIAIIVEFKLIVNI